MKISTIFILIIIIVFDVKSNIIYIPSDYTAIQTGINNAQDGDTLLVAPGIYYEQLEISGKSITLASDYIFTKDPDVISQTIIDGSNGPYIISISSTAGIATSIEGLTIQDADDGIRPYTHFKIANCYITNCSDGIDYEDGSGGICIDNTFENNSDDGIDLDNAVDILIENNKIIYNDDDGIEIRLQNYNGTPLDIIIKNNVISGNNEDGIQLIDYSELSNRTFYIESNLIIDNAEAGLGCMADGNTSEDYSGAAIPETIYLVNNTFSGNNHGITGGANLTASNNIVANCAAIAMKNVNGNSLISYSNFWNNGQNFDNCIIDDQSLIYSNPLFIAANDYHIQNTSPCIQSGTVIGAPEIDIEYEQRGNPPDIGAYEYISNEDQGLPVEMQHYEGNYLNGNIELNWVTTGELNNLGYEIFVKNKKQNEYKYLAGYSEENSLLGLGNSPQGKQYNYIHQNVDPGMTYSYKLIQYDFSGVYTEYGPIEISTTSDKNYDNFSRPTTLLQNYPNPFNPNTRISYQLPVISNVELNIYNQLGQKVATLVNKKQNSGMYRVEWDAGNLSSGIYFYIIKTGHFQDMKKMILIK